MTGISFKTICILIMILTQILIGDSLATPAGHHSFLQGPWELLVQMGMETEGMCFPIKVSDCNKVNKLKQIFPVKGTPIKIKLENYLPNLRWETNLKKSSNGGFAAKVVFKGENLNQEMWLSSADQTKSSISSSIGGIKIIELHDANTIEKLAYGLESGAVGILTIWPNESNKPVEFIAFPSKTISLQNSPYKINIGEYVSHYSYDTKTKKVSNQLDNPRNPAVKVSIDDGKAIREGWVWEKFGTYPHMQKQMPLRMAFTSLDHDSPNGSYLLLVARGATPQLVLAEDGKQTTMKAMLGESFTLANKKYSFSIESLTSDAAVETTWKNNSDNLLNPALIAAIENDHSNEQVVMEFGKPFHYKTESGTLVLLFRGLTMHSKDSSSE